MQKPTDFLSSLIEPSRAKVLRLFVVHDKEHFTFSEVARRAKVTPRTAVNEVELLVRLGVVKEERGEGKTARQRKSTSKFSFNERGRHANVLSTFVHEVAPEEFTEIERSIKSVGRLSAIVLSGIFLGDVQRPVDVIIVGDFVNDQRLEKVVKKLEQKCGREIRYAVFSTPEFRYRLTIHDKLVRDTLDFPHRVLLNKNNLI